VPDLSDNPVGDAGASALADPARLTLFTYPGLVGAGVRERARTAFRRLFASHVRV
jgi:hypothetical protein